jgi:hypothetical protein
MHHQAGSFLRADLRMPADFVRTQPAWSRRGLGRL